MRRFRGFRKLLSWRPRPWRLTRLLEDFNREVDQERAGIAAVKRAGAEAWRIHWKRQSKDGAA